VSVPEGEGVLLQTIEVRDVEARCPRLPDGSSSPADGLRCCPSTDEVSPARSLVRPS